MGTDKISSQNTVRENWNIALKNDGMVDNKELAEIVQAAVATGGISTFELNIAKNLLDELKSQQLASGMYAMGSGIADVFLSGDAEDAASAVQADIRAGLTKSTSPKDLEQVSKDFARLAEARKTMDLAKSKHKEADERSKKREENDWQANKLVWRMEELRPKSGGSRILQDCLDISGDAARYVMSQVNKLLK